MIRLYTAPTPNGRKVSVALEELGLRYDTTWVKIDEGHQNAPEFVKMNPNKKIPVLDDDGTVVFESGAILIYLAEKTGKLLPARGAARDRVLDTVLACGREQLAGDYSIADIMTYPWVKAAFDAQAGLVTPFKALTAWMERVGAKPGVQRGMAVPQ